MSFTWLPAPAARLTPVMATAAGTHCGRAHAARHEGRLRSRQEHWHALRHHGRLPVCLVVGM